MLSAGSYIGLYNLDFCLKWMITKVDGVRHKIIEWGSGRETDA